MPLVSVAAALHVVPPTCVVAAAFLVARRQSPFLLSPSFNCKHGLASRCDLLPLKTNSDGRRSVDLAVHLQRAVATRRAAVPHAAPRPALLESEPASLSLFLFSLFSLFLCCTGPTEMFAGGERVVAEVMQAGDQQRRGGKGFGVMVCVSFPLGFRFLWDFVYKKDNSNIIC